jgi:peptide deformylase
MIRPIVKYGDATVHRPAAPVSEVTPEIRQLVDDMILTMYAAPGVGLAAPSAAAPRTCGSSSTRKLKRAKARSSKRKAA